MTNWKEKTYQDFIDREVEAMIRHVDLLMKIYYGIDACAEFRQREEKK
jgi:hypothetical protein